jgi:hypothetical protein
MILAKYELLKEKVLKVTITLYNVPYRNTKRENVKGPYRGVWVAY